MFFFIFLSSLSTSSSIEFPTETCNETHHISSKLILTRYISVMDYNYFTAIGFIHLLDKSKLKSCQPVLIFYNYFVDLSFYYKAGKPIESDTVVIQPAFGIFYDITNIKVMFCTIL